MDGPQLQQFAAAHQDNAIYVSLAMQVDKDRKEEMQRLQALMTGQDQPKVISQAVAALNPQGMAPPGMGAQQQGGAPMPPPGGPQGPMPPQGMPPQGPPGMQMPPQAPPAPQGAAQPGIAGLPTPNMQGMADGGIAGYADDEEVHMAGGGTGEDAIRAQLKSLGYPPELIEAAVQRERMAAENAQPQRDLAFTPATTSAVAKDNVSMTRDPGYDPWKKPPTISQLHGDPVNPEATSPFGELLKSTGQSIGRGLTGIGRGLQGAVQAVRDVGDPLKNPRELEARRLEKAAAVDPGYFEAITPTERAQREAEAANIRSTFPMSDYSNEGRGKGAVQTTSIPNASVTGAPVTGAPVTGAPRTGTPRTGTPRTGTSAAAPTPPAGIETLVPENATVGKTPQQAMEAAGQFSIYPQYVEGQTLLNKTGEQQDKYLRDIFAQRPSQEIGRKTEEYIKGQREELEKEKGDRGANFLISAGLAIASGTSRNAMQNIAQGLQVGVKDAKDAMKDFKAAQKELARMDADLENLRAAQKERDFDRMFSLEQRIADRDESRKQKMFDGAMTLAGQDRALAGNIYSLAEQNAEAWKRTKAEFGFKRGEREATEKFAAAEAVKDRANRVAAASIDKEGDRLRELGGGNLLAGYKALKELNKDKFDLATAYSHYLSTWKRDPMVQGDRPLNGAEFAAQMGGLYTTTTPPAGATILPRK